MVKLSSVKSSTAFLLLLAFCNGESLRPKSSHADEHISNNIVANKDLLSSHIDTPLDAMKETMGNTWETIDPVRDTPYFWHVPLAGGELALSYFSVCTGLTEATRAGAGAKRETLEVVHVDGHPYVNVDLSNRDGILHASSLGLATSHMADVTSSAFVTEMSTLFFDHANVGKMFAIFRHPIHRLVDKFFVMQRGALEGSELATLTLEEYAKRPKYVGENWMTRMLVGKLEGPLSPDDLKTAKKIIKTKCLVGLTTQLDESVERFEKYFGWEERTAMTNQGPIQKEECRASILDSRDTEQDIFNPEITFIDADSDIWDSLMKVSYFDVELYMYAVQVFAEQRAMFAA